MINQKKIEKFLSEPRLKPYMAYGNDGLLLYQMNLRLSGAFMPILSMLEVSLRNAIDDLMTNEVYRADLNWIDAFYERISQNTKLNIFKNQIDNVKDKLAKKEEKSVRNEVKIKLRQNKDFKRKTEEEQKAIIDLEVSKLKKNQPTNSQNVKIFLIANMDFAFWTTFFDIEAHKYFEGYIFKIFKKFIQREDLFKKLNNIREFRNRIAHNESIIFIQQRFNIKYAQDTYKDIMYILELLDEDLKIYSEDIYNICNNIQKINDYLQIIKEYK